MPTVRQDDGRSVAESTWPAAALTLGFCSMIAQLLGLREFLAAWATNELVIGAYLGCSLLLTAFGSMLGVRPWVARRGSLTRLLLVSAPLPALHVALLRLLRGWLAVEVAAGLTRITVVAFLSLLPVAMVYGVLFARATAVAAAQGRTSRVYAAEAAGAVAGGVVYTVATGMRMPVFVLACIPLVASCLACIWILACQRRTRASLATAVLAAVACILIGASDLSRLVLAQWFPGQRIIEEVDSPYGDLVVTSARSQVNLFQDGVPVASSGDSRFAELVVHVAMAQRPQAQHVLLLGGIASGAVEEILAYRVGSVDVVESDAALAELALRLGRGAGDERVRLHIEDPRHYVAHTGRPYDIVILATPGPSTAAANRLYTVEFFRDVARALSAEGVVGLVIEGSENYRGAETLAFIRAIFSTLRAVFPDVAALPLSPTVLVASRGPLTIDVADVLERLGIETHYVDRGRLAGFLTAERLARLRAELSVPGVINHDVRPSAYRFYLDRWLEELGGSALWPAMVLLVACLGGLARTVVAPGLPTRAAVATSGFASLTLEVCLLLAYQMVHGSLYLGIGILISAFMAGGAVGARFGANRGPRTVSRRWLVGSDAALVLLAVSVAAVAQAVGTTGLRPSLAGFAVVLSFVGFVTGLQFPIAVSDLAHGRRGSDGGGGQWWGGQPSAAIPRPAQAILVATRDTSDLYSADLIGAAIGAAVTTVALVPALGIVRVCLLVAVVKASSMGMLMVRAYLPSPVVREPLTSDSSSRLVALVLLAGTAVLAAAPGTRLDVYAFSFEGGYHAVLLVLLALGLALSSIVRPVGNRSPGIGWGRGIVGKAATVFRSQWARVCHVMVFALASFYPLVRCYFEVPYVFCHVCPRVCVFGYLRPFWVPAAVLMNLGSYSWCRRMCPIGAAFEPGCHRRTSGRRIGRVVAWARLVVLALVGWSYFAIAAAAADQDPTSRDLYAVLFKNAYAVSTVVLAMVVVLLLINRWIPRAFCSLLCPVGAVCDLAHGAIQRVPDKGTPRAREETCGGEGA